MQRGPLKSCGSESWPQKSHWSWCVFIWPQTKHSRSSLLQMNGGNNNIAVLLFVPRIAAAIEFEEWALSTSICFWVAFSGQKYRKQCRITHIELGERHDTCQRPREVCSSLEGINTAPSRIFRKHLYWKRWPYDIRRRDTLSTYGIALVIHFRHKKNSCTVVRIFSHFPIELDWCSHRAEARVRLGRFMAICLVLDSFAFSLGKICSATFFCIKLWWGIMRY